MTTASQIGSGVEELLPEQLRWIRAAAMPSVRETIETALGNHNQRQAFELCDGTRTSVAKTVGVSKTSISGWATHWRNLGIAHEVEGCKIGYPISLSSLGVPLEVKAKAEEGVA
jgi:hypothetical protein